MALLMSGLYVRVILKASQVAGGPRYLFESFNKSAPPLSRGWGGSYALPFSPYYGTPPRPRKFPLLAPPSLQKKKGGGAKDNYEIYSNGKYE